MEGFLARVVKWQTRTFEGRMPKGVGVQVPPRARFALALVRDWCGLERVIIGNIPSNFASFLFSAGSIAARHENRHLPEAKMALKLLHIEATRIGVSDYIFLYFRS